jgi:hypothetical protein
MSAVLSEAETKFFSSKGADVDASLTAEAPATTETPPEAPKPAENAPSPASAKPAELPPEKTPAAEPSKESDKERQLLGALQGERDRRQKAEREQQQFAKALQEMQEQIRQLSQPPEQIPNPDEDPQGYLLYHLQKQNTELEGLRKWREEQEGGSRQRQAIQNLQQRVNASEAAFRQATPDYDKAAQFAITQHERMLAVEFPDPAQRRQQVAMAAAGFIHRAVQRGEDPAAAVYNFAKSMGYTATPAAAPAAPVVPAVPPPAATNEVVKTLEKGLKQQSKGSGGATPPAEMTGEQLLALDGQEFLDGWDKAFKRKR